MNPEDLEVNEEDKEEQVEEDETVDREEEQEQEDLEEDLKIYEEYTHDKNVVINHFKGSINAPFSSTGNVNVGFDDLQVFQIDREELEELQEVYQAVPNYEQMSSQLRADHLLFIYHSQHLGKYSSGLSLLTDFTEKVYQIYPSVSVKELMDTSFQTNTGYIIDTIDTTSINQFDSFALRKIQQKLLEMNSYLVITHNADQLQMENYTISGEGPDAIVQVIENHLFTHDLSPVQLSKINEILENTEFNEFLQTNQLRPRDVGPLIDKLSLVIEEKATFDEVFYSLKQNVLKRIKSWFEQQEDFNLITYMIALAVFNGQSYELVGSAAKQLRSHLTNDGTGDTTTPFKYSKEKLLAELQAEEFEPSVNTHHGMTKTRHLRFKNKDDVEAILYYVWNNYPDEHQAIIDWIKQVAKVDSPLISERVAESVAFMCQSEPDFYFLRAQLIEPWAKSEKLPYRLTAALILANLSAYKEHIAQIGKLVHSWATNQNKNLQWTAAVSYGTPIGINVLPQALIDLKEIYSFNKGFTRKVAYDGFDYLYTYGNHEQAFFEMVIDFNQWWVEHKINDLDAALGLTIFTSLLENSTTESLLNLFQNKKLLKKSVVKVTEEAIKRTKTRKSMLQVLEKWLRLVDQKPELAPFVEYFLLVLLIESNRNIEEQLFGIFNRVIESPNQKQAIAIANTIMN